MLTFRPSRAADRAFEVAAGRVVARVLVAGASVLVATTVVRIQRLRRTAASHAHDLERAATVGEGRGAAVRLLVLGDSAARGYGLTDPDSAFPRRVAGGLSRVVGRPVAVTSLATDGHRTADVLAEQVPELLAARPDVVVVSVGVNDAVRRTPRDALDRSTEALLAEVTTAADGAVVVVVPCPDLGSAPGFGWPLARVVGWACRRVARVQQQVAARHDVVLVPLPRPDATMFGVDGFHPGATGHAAMADLVVDALRTHADRLRDRAATPVGD